MEKKSDTQQKSEARYQVKGAMTILKENNKKKLDKEELKKIMPDRDKIEPYVMPNVSKNERAEVVAKSVNTRDCFGRKPPTKQEYSEDYYIWLQSREEGLIQSIERGLDACEEDGYDSVEIEELRTVLSEVIESSRKSKIDAINISLEKLFKIDAKIQELVDKHEPGFKW